MNIEQAVLKNLRELPSQNQQEVLTFIEILQQRLKPDSSAQRSLQTQFADKLLPDLQHIQHFHDGYPSAVYADSLLRTLQNIFDQFPDHPLTAVLMVFHDAMAVQNRWTHYTPDQYQGAHTLLDRLFSYPSLSQSDVTQAIQALSDLGFNTMPYEVTDSDLDADIKQCLESN